MPKTIRPLTNGGATVPSTDQVYTSSLPLAPPVKPFTPAKTQDQLLREVDMEREIARLKAENDALRNRPQGSLTLKISEKGALSVYGMGRWPFTLYREQWERVLGAADEIRAFIKANSSRLKLKGQD